MTKLERKLADLRETVDEIVRQYQLLDAAVAGGPHVELSCQELRVVEWLGDEGPKMMRELAEFLGLAVNSVTSLVDHLEEKEIVRRLRSEADRRIVRVELTDGRGRVVFEAARREMLTILRGMLTALTDEEQDIFLVLFRKIARAARAQAQKLATPA
ncbi:MAG: MarR family transcriptional regulator [Gemmataceae bacterium]